MARLGHGLRSLLRQCPVRRYRRACGFDVRSSRACAFRGTAVKQSIFRAVRVIDSRVASSGQHQ
eukprot:4459786-Pleurochrysis_carterae.AAC.1